MGCPFGPLFADFYVCDIEEQPSITETPREVHVRCVDGIFIGAFKMRNISWPLKRKFGEMSLNVKFTHEFSDGDQIFS